MDTYAVHLAMAALVGASLVAVSAYYMHRKTLTQLLEFAKTVEKERERERDDNSEGESPLPQHLKKRRSHGRRKGNGYYRRGPGSLPDVAAISGAGIDGEEKRNGLVQVDGIPPGLPWLHMQPEGMGISDFSPE